MSSAAVVLIVTMEILRSLCPLLKEPSNSCVVVVGVVGECAMASKDMFCKQ